MTSVERLAEILLCYHFTLMQPQLLTHLLIHRDPSQVVKRSYGKKKISCIHSAAFLLFNVGKENFNILETLVLNSATSIFALFVDIAGQLNRSDSISKN